MTTTTTTTIQKAITATAFKRTTHIKHQFHVSHKTSAKIALRTATQHNTTTHQHSKAAAASVTAHNNNANSSYDDADSNRELRTNTGPAPSSSSPSTWVVSNLTSGATSKPGCPSAQFERARVSSAPKAMNVLKQEEEEEKQKKSTVHSGAAEVRHAST
ncbi:unnamed protein product [Ceratitis capitata]|uniref:(Mediterranean fruit fly) hypothetical protein n=1 Tax=Ceratitis capitata TaxID=7213 RepID=A0A811VGG8_CERCA|nr:unnamed protein product [Ceratitis capitata]